jgi:His/Glu/Gln/Arg/opine family amino acid ABC transporter permease subunit
MPLLDRWVIYFIERGLYSGLFVALRVLAVTAFTTVVWGLVCALMRMSSSKVLRFLATAYVEIFRGTPLLIQLLIIFAAIPMITGIFFSPFVSAVLALTLNAGSYMAESYRSGFMAVPVGQREAASSLGMSRLVILRRVILPQAIRVILPATGNVIISLLLTTPFVYLVGLQDMMAKANQIVSFTGDFSVYLLVTIIYAIIGTIMFVGNSFLEQKLRIAS